jgi:hypothetical protein
VPADLRQKWVKNFWILEQLRGLGFQSAMMPEDSLNDRAIAIVLMDAALEICMMGVWIGFQVITVGWSCQLLIARSALAGDNSTIPKNELQALCPGSNLGGIDEKIVASDSTIALYWTIAEMKPLAMFH